MPMGIVSDSEFESELINGLVKPSITSTIIQPVDNNKLDINNDRPINPPQDPSTDNPEVRHITTRELKDSHGRNMGDLNVPNVLRKIIGEHSAIHGRSDALKIADAFKVSPSSVSAYQEGATSTSTIDKPQEELNNYIIGHKKKLTKKAMHKLGMALTKLTDNKMDECDGPQLAHVAQIMSTVVKNLDTPIKNADEDKDRGNKGPNITFITPVMKSEEAYTFIHTRE